MNSINITLDLEEFRDELLLDVKKQLEAISKNLHSNKQEELLTRKQTAELLKINLATLWSWTRSNKIKSVGIGNRVYYRYSDIQDSLIELS